MANLIDKQSVLEIAMCYCPDDDGCCSKAGNDLREMLDEIEALPTIEPEVLHAYWETNDVGEYYCTNCVVECDIDEFHKAPLNQFCGNCGAKMGWGADNDSE